MSRNDRRFIARGVLCTVLGTAGPIPPGGESVIRDLVERHLVEVRVVHMDDIDDADDLRRRQFVPPPAPPGPNGDVDEQAAPPQEELTSVPGRRGGKPSGCLHELLRLLESSPEVYCTEATERLGARFSASTVVRGLNKLVAAGIADHPAKGGPYRLKADE